MTLEQMLEQHNNPQSKQEMNETIEKINEESFNVYKQLSLLLNLANSIRNMVQCENCGRRFSALDRLDIHLRSCRPGSTARPIGSVRPQTSSSPPPPANPSSNYEAPPPQVLHLPFLLTL